MEKIVTLSYELKELLSNDERVVLLNKLEEGMNNNEEVMRLAYIKDNKADAYETALRFFSEDSEEVKTARNALYIAKKELDEHPLVREYLKAYSEVRNLYLQMNEKLFSIIDQNLCKHEGK